MRETLCVVVLVFGMKVVGEEGRQGVLLFLFWNEDFIALPFSVLILCIFDCLVLTQFSPYIHQLGKHSRAQVRVP